MTSNIFAEQLDSKGTTESLLDISPNTPCSMKSYPPSPQSPAPSPAYPRNFSFYYDYRSFLVEGTLFRFPINLLAKESEVFRDMMEIPAPSQAEGLTDENPIRLDGVLHDDFVKLLTILAPPQRFKEPVPTLSFSEWTSVLRLADMWCMDVVKEHAIATMNQISNVDPIDKVVVARKYGVDSWLVPSFDALLRRSKPWDEQDVERLGLSTVLKLVELRDRLRPQTQYGFSWEIALARQEILGSVDFRGTIIAELPDFKGKEKLDFKLTDVEETNVKHTNVKENNVEETGREETGREVSPTYGFRKKKRK